MLLKIILKNYQHWNTYITDRHINRKDFKLIPIKCIATEIKNAAKKAGDSDDTF